MRIVKFPALFKKNTFWIYIFLFILAATLRLLTMAKAPIYDDEITWMVRGKETIYALIHHNFTYFRYAWWTDTTETQAIALPLVLLNGGFHVLLAGAGKYSFHLLSDIIASRLPIVILSSFLPLLIYYYGASFFTKRIALLGAVLYALNPIAINIDTWILNDSLLTLFTFLSIAIFYRSAQKGKNTILPGFFLSLSLLTKPLGILPIAFWIIYFLINNRTLKVLKLILYNLAFTFILIIVLWPQSWFNPIFALPEYLYRQANLVQTNLPVYYWGEVTFNPGWSYYFFQFFTRMPEGVILGFIFYLVFFVINFKKNMRDRKKNFLMISVFGYLTLFLLFLLSLNLSAQKLGIRYALPILPWLILLAASGLWGVFNKLKGLIFKGIYVFAMAITLIYPIFYWPDYHLFYNYLIGGPKGAQKYDMVGVCASSKPAIEYLNSIKYDGKIYVAGCQSAAYYYTNIPIVNDFKEAGVVVLETYFQKQHPEREVFEFLKDKPVWKSFEKHGAVIAEIYIND